MTTQTAGDAIRFASGKLQVPHHPIIPFIEGDGIGPDIWAASQRVFDQAVQKAYGGERSIAWKEVLAGQKAKDNTGNWLPDETIEAFNAADPDDPHFDPHTLDGNATEGLDLEKTN